MPPGRKVSRRTRQVAESTRTEYENQATPTEYEKLRAINMMKNNQLFQRLGLSQLKTMMTNVRENSKNDGPQESGSLYDDEDSEASEKEEVSKDSQVVKGVRSRISNDDGEIHTKGTLGSKRIVAPDVHEQPIRVTRRRKAAINQESAQCLTAAAHASSRAATNQDSTQSLTAATQPTPSAATNQDSTQELVPRQRSMGRQLESLSRGLGIKIPIQISEGKRRPEPPIQAAKLASEGGIILRQHIPIFPHWKEYKKKENESKITDYIGKLGAQFTMDVDSEPVKSACVDLLKGGQRQMRYRLKKKFFTWVPANQVRTTSPVSCMTDDQWRKLVQMWSTPEHKENCIKNQLNHEKVQFQQRMGSRSYIAKAYVVKQEKYKDVEPSAIDLFKEMHCSKNKGFSENVHKAIVDMEAMVAAPVQDGEQPKSCTEVVSHVMLDSSSFLRNVGLQPTSKKSSALTVSAKVQELQDQLETERQEKDGLREEVETLKTQAQESQATIDNLKKSMEENNSLLRQLLSFNRGQDDVPRPGQGGGAPPAAATAAPCT